MRGATSGTTASEPLRNATRVLDKWLEFQCRQQQLPGLVVAIAVGGKPVFCQGYGCSRIERRTLCTRRTRFRVASISKVFTATAVMQLVEEGKLKLNDRVSTLTRVVSKDKRFSATTVRQLLSHHSGITRDGDTPHWVSFEFPHEEAIRRQEADHPIVLGTRRRFKYSNFGFGVLGQIIGTVSGKSYEDYVQRSILDRLQMRDTFVDLTRKARRNLATGYSRRIPGRRRTGYRAARARALAPAAGFVSTAPDLCRFLSAHMLGNSTLLRDSSKRRMRRLGYWNKDSLDGYGLGLMSWKVGKRRLFGHSGGFPGFITRMAFDERDGLAVVVLTNAQDGPAKSLLGTIFRTIDYIERHAPRSRLRRVRGLDRYEGHFSGRWGDLQILNLEGQLTGFWLTEDTPISTAFALRQIDDNVFGIADSDPYGNHGEHARFEFSKRGRLKGIVLGPNPLKIVVTR